MMTPRLTTETRMIGTLAQRISSGFRLQKRDVAIVDAVHRHRVLSATQIAALFFTRPEMPVVVSSACRSRLRHLSKAGYLERAEQLQTKTEGRRPYLYMLTTAGCDLLIDELGYDPADIDWVPEYNNVRWPFLRHQLAINDVFVSFWRSGEQLGWSIDPWIDDRILRKQHVDRVRLPGTGRMVAVIPDAYFRLVSPDRRSTLQFFLEVDRATVAVAGSSHRTRSWQEKIQAYGAYFQSQSIVDLYDTRKIRVLTVTTGQTRLENLKTATETAGGRRRYWFAERSLFHEQSPLTAPIWYVSASLGPRPLLADFQEMR